MVATIAEPVKIKKNDWNTASFMSVSLVTQLHMKIL
jgi:hypothetical protein